MNTISVCGGQGGILRDILTGTGQAEQLDNYILASPIDPDTRAALSVITFDIRQQRTPRKGCSCELPRDITEFQNCRETNNYSVYVRCQESSLITHI
jgi:hypothetical protein